MKFWPIKSTILLLFLLSLAGKVFPYNDREHHPLMCEVAVEQSVLDTYLKDNLDVREGIKAEYTNNNEPENERVKTIIDWVKYGGCKEDDFNVQLTRCNNHFYDPTTGKGLTDNPGIFPVSSLSWGQNNLINDYSWSKAREYYYLALTSEDIDDRNMYWALTFRSLGQVCHLLQDLACPAHVRNDNHGPLGGFPNEDVSSWGEDKDPYEAWASTDNNSLKLGEDGLYSDMGMYTVKNILSLMKGIPELGIPASSTYQYSPVKLEKFDYYWDNNGGKGLAEFTNSNFVSKDTNIDKKPDDPHWYANPQETGTNLDDYTFIDSDGVERNVKVCYNKSDIVDNYASGKSINDFGYLAVQSFWNFYTKEYDPEKVSYTLNSKCHEEYAKQLIPRAVGYSAGLIDYFFRGKLELEDFYISPSDGNKLILKLKNISSNEEDLEGGTLAAYSPLGPNNQSNRSSSTMTINGDNLIASSYENISNGTSVEFEIDLLSPYDELNGQLGDYRITYSGGTLGSEEFNDNQLSACLAIKKQDIFYGFTTTVVDGEYSSPLGYMPQLPYLDANRSTYSGKTHNSSSRAIINFPDVSAGFLGDREVKCAKLFIPVTCYASSSSLSGDFSVYRITAFPGSDPWEATAHPEYDPIPLGSCTISKDESKIYEIDITSVWNGWNNGDYENYGLVLKLDNETLTTSSSVSDVIYLGLVRGYTSDDNFQHTFVIYDFNNETDE